MLVVRFPYSNAHLVHMGLTAPNSSHVVRKVATRLQDFESQITAQLSNLQTDRGRMDGSGGRRCWLLCPTFGAGQVVAVAFAWNMGYNSFCSFMMPFFFATYVFVLVPQNI